jgi:hypothetical protein
MNLRTATAALFALLLAAGTAFGSATVFTEGGRQKVRFQFKPSGAAKQVQVAGSFNDWGRDALRDDDGDGTWEAVLDLPPGRHTYKFVVDGQWLQDPDNPQGEPDGHGGKNSVIDAGGQGQSDDAGQADDEAEVQRPITGGGESSPFGSTQVREQQRAFSGSVYFVEPGTQKLPDFNLLEPVGEIFAETFEVAPRNFAEGFPGISERFEWFAIRYRGTFQAPKSGVYRFRFISDDAGRVYLNRKLALDNDGLHGPREVVQKVRLKKGEHELIVDYMQGPALEVALELYVIEPGSTSEKPVRATSLARPRE